MRQRKSRPPPKTYLLGLSICATLQKTQNDASAALSRAIFCLCLTRLVRRRAALALVASREDTALVTGVCTCRASTDPCRHGLSVRHFLLCVLPLPFCFLSLGQFFLFMGVLGTVICTQAAVDFVGMTSRLLLFRIGCQTSLCWWLVAPNTHPQSNIKTRSLLLVASICLQQPCDYMAAMKECKHAVVPLLVLLEVRNTAQTRASVVNLRVQSHP